VLCLRAEPEQAGKETWFVMKESRGRERNSKGKAIVK